MSNVSQAPIQPSSPDKNPAGKEEERVHIPGWWSIVALIMAGLVFLPIQYANIHTKKAAPEESQAAKPAVEQAEAQPKSDAVAAAKLTTPEPKEEVAAAEPVKPAAAEATQKPEPAEPAKEAAAEAMPPKQEAVQAEPVKPAAAQTAQLTESMKPVKPAATDAPAKKEDDQPAKLSVEKGAPAGQKVALNKPAEKLKVEDTILYRIEGKDKQGRDAAFDFMILSNGYKWAKGSSSQIVSGEKVIPDTEAPNHVLAPKVRDSLGSVSDVIAVGLASKEGKRTEEEARAMARSKTIATWVKKVAKPDTALWTLSLGQYQACKEAEGSDFDRPVLLVGVRSKSDGANLQEALADALTGHDNLPSRECYSRFEMVKVR